MKELNKNEEIKLWKSFFLVVKLYTELRKNIYIYKNKILIYYLLMKNWQAFNKQAPFLNYDYTFFCRFFFVTTLENFEHTFSPLPSCSDKTGRHYRIWPVPCMTRARTKWTLPWCTSHRSGIRPDSNEWASCLWCRARSETSTSSVACRQSRQTPGAPPQAGAEHICRHGAKSWTGSVGRHLAWVGGRDCCNRCPATLHCRWSGSPCRRLESAGQ